MNLNLLSRLSLKRSYNKFAENIRLILNKLKNLTKTNFDLGVYHLNNNNLNDAILRFKIVIYFDRNNIEAYYLLGKSLLLNQENLKAEKFLLKALELSPGHGEVKYFLAIISDKYPLDNRIPISIVKDYYEQKIYNSNFTIESSLSVIIEDVSQYISNTSSAKKILDLGFGEGDLGYLLRNKFTDSDITGVEIAGNAIISANKKVQNKIIYNTLIEQDFYKYLQHSELAYDLMFAINSLCFDRNLNNIFELVRKHLNEKGLFIFKLEESKLTSQTLNASKKYFTYSKYYIEEELKNVGFTTHSSAVNDLTNDLLYICTK